MLDLADLDIHRFTEFSEAKAAYRGGNPIPLSTFIREKGIKPHEQVELAKLLLEKPDARVGQRPWTKKMLSDVHIHMRHRNFVERPMPAILAEYVKKLEARLTRFGWLPGQIKPRLADKYGWVKKWKPKTDAQIFQLVADQYGVDADSVRREFDREKKRVAALIAKRSQKPDTI